MPTDHNFMPADSPIERLLRAAACVELDPDASEAIRRACAAVEDWQRTIREAELHGMAPYLHMRLNDSGADVPAEAAKQLKALTFRHDNASRVRTTALLEIIDRLTGHGIEVLILKGAALAHLIYDRPGLRPMSDVDLLVAPERAARAVEILEEMEYKGVGHNLLPDHHHLPTISRTVDGLCISIEIHHDALAPDNIGSIRLDNLSEPARELQVDGAPARTLGHIDTLRHLCRHALEPRETMKIGSALDIMTYASRYAGGIDWPRLKSSHPEVVNMLRLLGYLIPWPSSLAAHVPPPPARPPAGVGTGMMPLSRLRRRQDRLQQLLNPSDWWLRGFYNVPPGRSLVYTKTVRHPARVLFWLWRRMGKVGH